MPDVNLSDWISLISAATALIAVVVSPWISLRISKRQIRASVVSANRQQWINELRDTIADFQATAVLLGLRQFNSDLTAAEEHDQMIKASTLRNKLHLLINPKEADHAHLADLADRIIFEVGPQNERDGKSVGKLQNEMTQTAQVILKREWERVKSGE